MEPIPNNQSLLDILLKFTRDFYQQFRELISRRGQTGNVGIFESKAPEIEEMIQLLNATLHELVLRHSAVTSTQLISIYQEVDLARLNPDVAKDIKQLIFHYTVTQQDEDLARIEKLLAKHDIR